jgi:pilus assembly protein CpaB
MLLILALAIISGLGAGYAALQYLDDRPAAIVASDDGETVPVILASQDLPLGTVLVEEDLRVVEWPAGAMPTGFASTTEELVGEALIVPVQTNAPILATNLADSGLRGIIPLIEPGMRAVSVRVDDIIGVAGFVTPQTKVDVILIMTPPGGTEPISKIILQNIQALASGVSIQETEEGEAIPVSVVTVLVTPEQAETLTLAQSTGTIRMALRHTLDLESIETPGQRQSLLFAGVGGTRRSAARSVSTSLTAEESTIEVYRSGVRSLIHY